MTIGAACESAGISTARYFKAMKRTAVQDHYDAEAVRYIHETAALRVSAKARAIEVALHLMQNAKSESVRARMAEFLASEDKAPQIAVHVDARQQPREYEYVPPGRRLVEIEAEASSEPPQERSKRP